ncbi:hypothetical protein L6452_36730 [Arctium lappa]|uniref:Uncharacterized protein n=1 Tax=Arctium lappa TaxID=4217 RepID=A0ACB8YE79_ARCLA|nr:hypothetical protein L6452_36730 [Arctium lappa]
MEDSIAFFERYNNGNYVQVFTEGEESDLEILEGEKECNNEDFGAAMEGMEGDKESNYEGIKFGFENGDNLHVGHVATNSNFQPYLEGLHYNKENIDGFGGNVLGECPHAAHVELIGHNKHSEGPREVSYLIHSGHATNSVGPSNSTNGIVNDSFFIRPNDKVSTSSDGPSTKNENNSGPKEYFTSGPMVVPFSGPNNEDLLSSPHGGPNAGSYLFSRPSTSLNNSSSGTQAMMLDVGLEALSNRPQATPSGVGLGSPFSGQAQSPKPKSASGLPSILGKPPPGPVEIQRKDKDNHHAAESGKPANDKKKSKLKVAPHKDYRPVQKKNSPPVVVPPISIPPKGSIQNLSPPQPKPKSPKTLSQSKAKAVSPSSNRFAILGDPSLSQGPGPSSSSSPIHMAPSEPMDASFEQDDLLVEEDVIEVDSDDGATAQFLTRDPMPSQVNPVSTLEPERMDSTPTPVS